MAEAVGQGTPTPTPAPAAQPASTPAPAPSAQPQGTPSAPATPAYPWASDQRFKDTDPEAFYKGYQSLEQKLGNHSQLEQFAKQIQEYAQQYGGLERLAQYAQYGAQQWQEAQNRQSQPAQPQGNPYERWDMLTPQEQAQLLQQQVMGQVSTYGQNLATELRAALEQQIGQALTGIQRQWDIYNRVMTKKLENPSLNVQDVLQQMVNLAQRGSDPGALMDLTINNMTLQQQIEQKANEIAQAKIADELQKQRNASLQTLTAVRPTGPTPESPGPRNSSDRKRDILTKLLASGSIAPNQV